MTSAIIGLGNIATVHASVLNKLGIEVVDVCDVDLEKAKSFINEYNLMNCLNKGTIIDITISKKYIVYVVKDEKDDIYFLTHKTIFKSFKEAKNYLMMMIDI